MRIANRTAVRAGVATVAAGVLAAGAFTLVGSAGASPARPAAGMHMGAGHVGYGFRTLDDTADPTFNQLLGINDDGLIAGYFGSGAQGHPNMGYLLNGTSYQSQNFPGSVQTQVTGLNNDGVTVGFYSGMNTANMMNDNSGFYAVDGQNFRTADFPAQSPASPPVD